ncbi:MAG: MBL fold metallo-hydrolase [Nibricoccus sp.]
MRLLFTVGFIGIGILLLTSAHLPNPKSDFRQSSAQPTSAIRRLKPVGQSGKAIDRVLAVPAERVEISRMDSRSVAEISSRDAAATVGERSAALHASMEVQRSRGIAPRKEVTSVPLGGSHTPVIATRRRALSAVQINTMAEPRAIATNFVLTPMALVSAVQAVPSVPDLSAAVSLASSEAVADMWSEVKVFCKDPAPQSKATIWTMFNVSPKVGQADCHLLEFPDGKKVLIDAAEGWDAQGAALNSLQQAGVAHLDLVVLSHVHWDHYGRLIDLINSGITVDRVVLNLPASREIADVEIPWGCNWDDVQSMLKFLRDHNIPYWTPQFGEKLVEVTQNGVASVLEVVCHYDAINSPIGRTDVNDTSMLLRLRHGRIKALFTGDLNTALGTWLATSDFDLRADLLKVPHHGTDGLAPNEFFDRVAPKAALVPSPRDLWYSLRSKRAREYFTTRKIPTYVSGLHGDVKVWISEDSFEIRTSGAP